MSYTLTVANNEQNNNNGQYVKAQLPNHQRTAAKIMPGTTIREALIKALKFRQLEPDMCLAFRLDPDNQTKQRIDWDVDLAMLKGAEIVVETKDRVPMHTQLSHDFARLYLAFSKCHFCQEFLMTGIKCLTCKIEFHRNCSNSVPKLCKPAIEHSTYCRYLLARSNGFSPTNNLTASDSPTNTSRPIRPRARSADENSKHKSKSVGRNDTAANNIVQNNKTNKTDHPESYIPTGSNHNNAPFSSSTINHLQPYYTANFHSTFNSAANSSFGMNISSGSNQGPSQQQTLTPLDYPIQQSSPNSQQPLTNRELLEEKWEIDGEEITRGAKIGQGSFATVYMGNWHGPVALKELRVKDPTPAQLQDFKNEVVVLKKTRHANILLFVGYVLKPELIIVTQWCKGRSLYKHLHVEERREFTNCEIKNIAIGVAQGMEYLHAKNIIHRDLKSNNIFIHHEDDLTVKIGDFGLATFKTRWEGGQQIYHPTGSILWMAPEVIRTKPGVNPFTFQSDVYSYGIVLYELLSRKLPYFDFKHKDALLFLIGLGDPERSPKLNLSVIGPDKPDGLRSLMLRCTERDPEKRPLFTSIISDLKKIKLSRIPRSTSEPLRLNDLIGSLALD